MKHPEHAFTCKFCHSHVVTWNADVFRCQDFGQEHPSRTASGSPGALAEEVGKEGPSGYPDASQR